MSATLDDTSKVIRRYLVKNADWVRVELPDEAFLPGDSQLTQYIIRYVVSLIPMFLFFLYIHWKAFMVAFQVSGS